MEQSSESSNRSWEVERLEPHCATYITCSMATGVSVLALEG